MSPCNGENQIGLYWNLLIGQALLHLILTTEVFLVDQFVYIAENSAFNEKNKMEDF
jgi:hypothetical protein